MTTRFRIADLRDENCDGDVFHAETSTWNEARQKATYGHDVPGCVLCALLDAVEALHIAFKNAPTTPLAVVEALDRFDFGDAAHA